jgi:hypothetical protein
MAGRLREVLAVSELTDWERDRLAALEQQLSVEDPELVARFAGPVRPLPPRAMARIAWAMIWVGVVLLPCGAALEDRSSVLVALLALACGPVLLRRARGAAREEGPATAPW